MVVQSSNNQNASAIGMDSEEDKPWKTTALVAASERGGRKTAQASRCGRSPVRQPCFEKPARCHCTSYLGGTRNKRWLPNILAILSHSSSRTLLVDLQIAEIQADRNLLGVVGPDDQVDHRWW